MDYKLIAERIKNAIRIPADDVSPHKDLLALCRSWSVENSAEAHATSRWLRDQCARAMRTASKPGEFYEVWKEALRFDAPVDFDSYAQYIELDREADKRFYQPRRRVLHSVSTQLQRLEDGELDLLAISLPPGVGKALANDTPILTRAGWKKHGDLQEGDEVIGMNGEFKRVLAVHPKCQLDVKIEFTNGEQILCHERHEWVVFNRHKQRMQTAEAGVLECESLDSGTPGRRGHRYHLAMPPHACVQGEEKELPLDPYVLGVWLGDGSNNTPLITSPKEDNAILVRILQAGFTPTCRFIHKDTGVFSWTFPIRPQLQSMGMCHSRRRTIKHIPEVYLTASVKQRLQLLAGLIDTDGTLNGSKFIFSNTEKKLIEDFVELVSTFGWRCCVTAQAPKVSSSGIHGRKTVYTVGFTPDIRIPCALQRKQNKNPHKQRRVFIKNISRVKPVEGNCITVEGDGMYLVGRTMLPTHNSTLALFYLTWLGGRHPEEPILGGSHSNSFLRGAYGEVLRILDAQGEYKWQEVFPDVHIVSTNAQDMMIDLSRNIKGGKRFATFEFSSVGSGNAGKVRAQRLLYCDDLVSDIQQAMSIERLDTLWTQYSTDLRQRKIGKCRELHIATRWSTKDVIGRLEERYGDSPRAEFVVLPALNEDDESNFDYGNSAGFTTQFYHEQREVMDDVSWRALYMNQPIEREGQLYSADELRRYFELPDSEPDAILAVCDTKTTGSDYCVLPIVYQYGNDYYLEDMVCDNGKPEAVEAMLVAKLVQHRVHMARFESNSAGGKIAETVQSGVKEKGGITKITTKYTTANKDTKIVVNSPWVKEHVLFKDDSVLDGNKVYRKFLQMLCGYTMAGKNKHDDVPDGMAQLSEFCQSLSGGKIEIFKRPY